MHNINEEFFLPIRYNSRFMERLNKRENDIIEKRNMNIEQFNRPRLEEMISDEQLNNQKEVDNLMKIIPHSRIEKIDNNLECIICLNIFKNGDKISTLPCQHIFHYNCLKKWIYEKRSCPLCKAEIYQ